MTRDEEVEAYEKEKWRKLRESLMHTAICDRRKLREEKSEINAKLEKIENDLTDLRDDMRRAHEKT